VIEYKFTKQIDSDLLHSQLSIITGFQGLNISDLEVTCLFNNELKGDDLTLLVNIMEAHNSVDPVVVVTKKVQRAKIRFENLANDFSTENILMGITVAGKTKLIADTLRDVSYYGTSGSLYEVLTSIDSIVLTEAMAPFLTTERVAAFRAKVVNLIDTL
jgi:hypothetical protein